MLFFIGSGGLGVFAFFVRQSVEQFACGYIGGQAGGALVKPAGLDLHDFGLTPCGAYPKRPDHPHRPALQESPHVFPADGRYLLPEALPEQGQEAVAMVGLFLAHLFKHLRCGGIGLPQGIGKFAVDAAVFLLVGDGDGQNLAFRQILEFLEHGPLYGNKRRVENRTDPPAKSPKHDSYPAFPQAAVCRGSTSVLPWLWEPYFLTSTVSL